METLERLRTHIRGRKDPNRILRFDDRPGGGFAKRHGHHARSLMTEVFRETYQRVAGGDHLPEHFTQSFDRVRDLVFASDKGVLLVGLDYFPELQARTTTHTFHLLLPDDSTVSTRFGEDYAEDELKVELWGTQASLDEVVGHLEELLAPLLA